MQDAGFCSKNISFDDPPKRGHFSCGKLVPHLRTSTVATCWEEAVGCCEVITAEPELASLCGWTKLALRLSGQLSLVGYLMEPIATHSDPSKCRRQISFFAKTLRFKLPRILPKKLMHYSALCCITSSCPWLRKIHSLSWPPNSGCAQWGTTTRIRGHLMPGTTILITTAPPCKDHSKIRDRLARCRLPGGFFSMSGFLPIGCVSYMNEKSSIVTSTGCGLMIQPWLQTLPG